ncbi:MAG: ATP-binding protein [Chloroflexi bacterium]|nr:MAG: ATP-binding protein [Chloroflexota bacterium]
MDGQGRPHGPAGGADPRRRQSRGPQAGTQLGAGGPSRRGRGVHRIGGSVHRRRPAPPFAAAGPGGQVLGDRVRLAAILGNLLDNAIKYSPDGGQIGIELSSDRSGASIRVSDPGLGIAKEHLEKVFKRFGRVVTAANSHIDVRPADGASAARITDFVTRRAAAYERRLRGICRSGSVAITGPALTGLALG